MKFGNLNKFINDKKSISKMRLFFWLAVIVMPLDSFPIFPIETVNRPLSVFFLIIYLVTTYIKKQSVLKSGIKFYLLVTGIFGLSVGLWLNGFTDKSVVYKTLLHYFIVIIYGVACIEFFKSLSYGSGIKIFNSGMRGSFLLLSLILIPVSVIQLLGRLDIVSSVLVGDITNLFSYRTVVDRIQGISGEAAQNFRFIFMFLIFFVSKIKSNLIIISIYLFFLLFSGSTFSIILLFLTGFVFILLSLNSFLSLKRIASFCLLGLFMIAFSQVFVSFSNDYTLGKIDLISRIISSPSETLFYLEKFSDGSSFLRIINPVIGFIISWESYLLGVGANSYHLYYYQIIEQYFPFAATFSSVAAVGSSEDIITAKSMLAKVAAEFGVLGILVVFLLFRKAYIALRESKQFSENLFFIQNKILFSYLVVLFCFTESYIYFPFCLLLCYFLVSLPNIKSIPKQNGIIEKQCF